MGSLRDRESFESFLNAQGYSPDVKEQARADFESRRKRLLISEAASKETAAQSSGFLRRAAGQGAAGMLNLANTATLGRIPQAARAVGAEGFGERFETGVQAAQQVNPGASMVGSLGGFFTPGSIAGGVTKLGARTLATATGARALATATAESALAARATAQVAQNLTGAAGGITALRLLEAREDDAGLTTRLSSAVEDIKSPVTIGTSVLFGGITAKLTGPRANKNLQYLFDQYRTKTGKEIPADIATDNVALQRFMDAAAREPGLAGTVAKVRTELVSGLRSMVSDMAKKQGATSRAESGRAAAGARRLIGVERDRNSDCCSAWSAGSSPRGRGW